ncbi:SAM-dependent methyltransferase, MidA family [Gulbenkiania indica]|uniref:SAM-dependent methyltransferase, MidA family n=1 Tax=Gulbenkiania indica TaxID=375574 RepID=A0A0K6GZ98_9NEIS|nr:SAM-dependent methyltransferase [Gulbenkiania indica]CUA84047.1 SAM-dependent methyltransferase, MidA family [Gulbenkiania indica]
MTRLPQPDATAAAHSAALVRQISEDIRARGGWIPFSRYMELALYAPGLGYYAAGSTKFGATGDFITAPEMTPLFGHTLARQVAELLPATAGTLYEFGAGTGRLAVDLLTRLEALGQLPEAYVIIDLSADLIDRQRATLAAALPHLIPRIRWLSALPDALDGVVLGNELLDAMPCELVVHDGQSPLQRGVALGPDGFVFEDRVLPDEALKALAASRLPPVPGYVSEISQANTAFIATLGARLRRGALLLIDYGYPRHEYYHPQRHMGTLIGHYRHHTVHDPFYLPGLMDLTCHVDFTAIAEAGLEAGLDLIGYTTQAQFLVNAGLAEELGGINADDAARYLRTASAVQKLTDPTEMGELFKVIGFGRGMPIDWCGFASGDRCHTL